MPFISVSGMVVENFIAESKGVLGSARVPNMTQIGMDPCWLAIVGNINGGTWLRSYVFGFCVMTRGRTYSEGMRWECESSFPSLCFSVLLIPAGRGMGVKGACAWNFHRTTCRLSDYTPRNIGGAWLCGVNNLELNHWAGWVSLPNQRPTMISNSNAYMHRKVFAQTRDFGWLYWLYFTEDKYLWHSLSLNMGKSNALLGYYS